MIREPTNAARLSADGKRMKLTRAAAAQPGAKMICRNWHAMEMHLAEKINICLQFVSSDVNSIAKSSKTYKSILL